MSPLSEDVSSRSHRLTSRICLDAWPNIQTGNSDVNVPAVSWLSALPGRKQVHATERTHDAQINFSTVSIKSHKNYPCATLVLLFNPLFYVLIPCEMKGPI